jgi:peptide/nickel transport system permease protein
MSVFILRRILQSLIVVLAMSLIVFVGVHVVGDPVHILISDDMTQEEIERFIRRLGLDRPMHEQYLHFLGNALSGDLGNSFVQAEPALKLILQRMPATLELALAALLMSVLLGVPLGMYAGLRPASPASRAIMAGSILGFSLPTFWVGLMLIMVFAVMLGWLPSTGRGETVSLLGVQLSFLTWDGLRHLLLPAFNLALFKISLVTRLARAGTREAALQDYVKFARAKGLKSSRVVLVHVLKNILIPVVTVLGLEFGGLIAFSVVTETVFAWPGMGKLLIDSIQLLDRPVVVAYLVITVVMFVVINLVVDILYSVLDPRVRLGEAGAS